MPPPSVIGAVVRPCFITVVMKMEKAVIRAVLGNIGPWLIITGTLIDLLCIQPFIKGSAVIEHTV